MAVAEAREVSPCRRSILTRKLLESMGEIESDEVSHDLTVEDLLDEKDEETLGRLFARCKVYLDGSTLENGSDLSVRANKYVPVFLTYRPHSVRIIQTYLQFGSAQFAQSLDDAHITHVIVDEQRILTIRSTLSK